MLPDASKGSWFRCVWRFIWLSRLVVARLDLLEIYRQSDKSLEDFLRSVTGWVKWSADGSSG